MMITTDTISSKVIKISLCSQYVSKNQEDFYMKYKNYLNDITMYWRHTQKKLSFI